MLERCGALAQVELADPAPPDAGLCLSELQPASAMVIAGWDEMVHEEVRAALAALGLPDEPPGPGSAAADAASLVAWLGPRRWLAITERDDAAAALATAVSGDCRVGWHCARAWLRLSGPAAEALLDAEAPVDLRATAFPDGAATQTLVSQVDTLVHARTREPAPAFDLLVGRSFAAHFARDLAHAAALEGTGLRIAPAGGQGVAAT